MKLLTFSFAFLSLLALPFFSHAQVPDIATLQQELVVSITPEYPKPESLVKISIESYTYDLNSSAISWTLNGRALLQGIGEKEVSVATGKIGSPMVLTATVTTPKGKVFSKTIPITPTNVTFLTQAMTYKPSLYEGRAPFTGESSIRIVAMPKIGDGAGTDPSTLVYRWTRNGTPVGADSGYGKRDILITGNFWGRDEVITVQVGSVGGETVAENTITIRPQAPQLLVYENNPLLGLLTNHALASTFNLKAGTEATFFAAPFGFIPSLLSGKTTYAWRMNGTTATNENGNTITFRNDSGESGRSSVSLKAEQSGANFESAAAGFSIQF